jgi:hypothetical protein
MGGHRHSGISWLNGNSHIKVSYEKSVFAASFLRATCNGKASAASGTKQWYIAKGGVYAMQPKGAWRNAA